MKSRVRVGIRVRPLNSNENAPVLTAVGNNSLEIADRRFTYDHVFRSDVSQEELFRKLDGDMLVSFLEGYNATIMAYGQTGSGKTFTMGSSSVSGFSESTGLIPRFMKELFESLPENGHVEASFLEVYGEDIRDLLHADRPSVTLREGGDGAIVCNGLTTRQVFSAEQGMNVLYEGTMNRSTAATLMNSTSSRSHAVFTITLTQSNTKSKLTFVDLAGSERMKKTGSSGERAKEGIDINKGLLALGSVINALSERLSHVPYRQSKLTRLLQEALGGNSQTLFLACVSPAGINANETLSTLHYANRARRIENAVSVNEDQESAEVRKWKSFANVLQKEVLALKFDTDSSKTEIESYFQTLKSQAMENDATQIVFETGKPLKTPSFPVATMQGVTNQAAIGGFEPKLLSEVDPDADMAILDQLLDLQQRDQEYDDEKMEDELKIKQVEGELEAKEGLLLQLRENLKVYHYMKEQYENLMAEVPQLEDEKAQLARQLEKARKDPSHGCSRAITLKLKKVEDSLQKAREDGKNHRDQCNKAQQRARRCQEMERKIIELKQGRAQLMKKQREDAARHRSWTDEKTKEILELKRKEQSQSQRLSKLENQIEVHKRNLNKRQEYCQKLLSQKQTAEKHLMQLMKTKQQKFDQQVQKTPDVVGFNKRVQDVIIAAASQRDYNDKVANYSQAMRKLMRGVQSNLDDVTLANLQVQVDSANFALEKSRSNLKEQPTLNVPPLVQHAVDLLVDSELKCQRVGKRLELKKNVIMTLETEVEKLNDTVLVLQSRIARDLQKSRGRYEEPQKSIFLRAFSGKLSTGNVALTPELAVSTTREKPTTLRNGEGSDELTILGPKAPGQRFRLGYSGGNPTTNPDLCCFFGFRRW